MTETVRRIDSAATLTVDLAHHRVQTELEQPRRAFAEALTDEGYAPNPA